MTEGDKLIRDLIDTLDNGIDGFGDSIQSSQRVMYEKVLELTGELELQGGKVKPSVKNLRVIRKIKTELEKAILNDKYKKSIEKYLQAYSEVDNVQQQYFSLIDARFSPGAIFREVRQQAIESVVDKLTESGLRANVTGKVQDILFQQVKEGVSYTELKDQMRTFLTNDQNGDGALARYASQITSDALYGYSRNYTALAADDLGLEWYKYVGSLKKTSRPFCVAMVDAAVNGCMEYIHRSQVDELLKGHICGKQIHINDKTDLPDGFIPGTTAANFISDNAGGYNCQHKMVPVSSFAVPQSYKDKIK